MNRFQGRLRQVGGGDLVCRDGVWDVMWARSRRASKRSAFAGAKARRGDQTRPRSSQRSAVGSVSPTPLVHVPTCCAVLDPLVLKNDFA